MEFFYRIFLFLNFVFLGNMATIRSPSKKKNHWVSSGLYLRQLLRFMAIYWILTNHFLIKHGIRYRLFFFLKDFVLGKMAIRSPPKNFTEFGRTVKGRFSLWMKHPWRHENVTLSEGGRHGWENMAGFIDSVSATFQVSFPIPRFLVSAIARSFCSIGGFSCSLVSSIARSCKQRRFLETLGKKKSV